MSDVLPSDRVPARPHRGRRVAGALAIVAMVAGAVLLGAAAFADSPDLALVLSGVVLVCVGGLASVLASPSVFVVNERREDRV